MAQGEGEQAHVTLLKALYDLGNGEPGRFFEYGRLFEVVGLTFDELIGATKQLISEGLIDPTFSDKVIGLTPAGVAAWDALLSERDGEPSNVAQTDLDGPRSTQRLSSILFLDIHGWSKLNQRGIVQYVSQVLPKVGQLLEDNAAKNVNTWGDAIVATFDSSDVAAKTALAIQRFFADGVVAFPAGIRCRISLNFGDVVMQFNPLTKRDDIFGNAVQQRRQAMFFAPTALPKASPRMGPKPGLSQSWSRCPRVTATCALAWSRNRTRQILGPGWIALLRVAALATVQGGAHPSQKRPTLQSTHLNGTRPQIFSASGRASVSMSEPKPAASRARP
jgi:hypothetical protein